jgi:hypothetical protein
MTKRGTLSPLFLGALTIVSPIWSQSNVTPNAKPSALAPTYEPISAEQRAAWVLKGTFGPANLGAGVLTSAWGTWHNSPKEWGPHWDGFGKRYGVRLIDGVSGGTIEAGLGAIWGEDPRYYRKPGRPLRERLNHVVASVFIDRDRFGDPMPAYARFIAIPANDFLSAQWRPESHATVQHSSVRIPLSFVNRVISNSFSEFWPDIKSRVFHHDEH